MYLIHVMRYKQHIYSTTSSELIIMVFWSNISTYTVVLLLVQFYFDSHEQLDFEWRVQFDCIDSNIQIDVRRMKYKAKDIILWYNTVNIHPKSSPCPLVRISLNMVLASLPKYVHRFTQITISDCCTMEAGSESILVEVCAESL